MVIIPGAARRDFSITLQGELGMILDWIERTGKPDYRPNPDADSTCLSVSVKAWAQPEDPCNRRRCWWGSS
jgi:hypothetical protein